MKLIKLMILFITLISFNVYADTCSYKEQTILNNDFSHVKIIYEILNDNQINILIYNLTENIYISYINPDTKIEESIFYYETNNGKYVLERNTNNLEEYYFKIRSTISNCYGNILTTKKIIKPQYNEFHKLEICKDERLTGHTYCKKFITTKIEQTESEIKKTLEDFKKTYVGVITTKAPELEKIDVKTIIKYSVITFVIILLITVVLIIKKKRGEL